jgi:hypothetical protein
MTVLIIILSIGMTFYIMSLIYPHEDFWDWKRKEPRWPLKGWLYFIASQFVISSVLNIFVEAI